MKSKMSRNMSYSVGALLVLTVSLCCFPALAATKGSTQTVGEIIGKAELVFQGKVTGITYKPSADGIPHTFVTYEMVEVFAGQVTKGAKDKGNTVTLRFIGGPKGGGQFLTVEHVPTFKVGDEDVLLVKGNGKEMCPLVSCSKGRFRLHDGLVYDGMGIPLNIKQGVPVSSGPSKPEMLKVVYPAPEFEEVYRLKAFQNLLKESGNLIDKEELRKLYEEKAPKEITLQPKKLSATKTKKVPVTGSQLDVDDLRVVLVDSINESKVEGGSVSSAIPTTRFYSKLPKPQKPQYFSQKEDDFIPDSEEYRMMKEQGFNPVLPKK